MGTINRAGIEEITIIESPTRPVVERPEPTRKRAEEESFWDRWSLNAAAVGCWFFLLLAATLDHLTDTPHAVVLALYALAFLAGGTFATRDAITDLFHGQVNVDLLMVSAAAGAAIVNAWGEGAVLLALFSSSNALEHHALGRTRRAVQALMDLSPDVATLIGLDGERVVPVETLQLNDMVLVRPGDRVAVDGVVITGESNIDQSAITGESIPVTKRPGDQVYAGTINHHGALEVKVTKIALESTLAKIIEIVEAAQEQKSGTQRFTDRFEGTYAVGVIGVAALFALVPPLLLGHDWGDAFYRSMTLLVVASPCALVISTPASTLSALANAARNGILFKGARHLEAAGAITTIAFDKTGTLTEGKPKVTDFILLVPGIDENALLARVASAERLSEHPLGEAILAEGARRGLAIEEATNFRAVPGRGIVATVGGEIVAVGNEALFRDEFGVRNTDAALAAADLLRDDGKTSMFVGSDRGIDGIIAVADTVRPQAKQVVADLHALGVTRTIMLTGDNDRVAQAIARQLGIDEVHADLLPEEKLVTIQKLMETADVAMVGDGVNDAPALATATIGIAMGGAGTDVALETADVVLMADDLTKLPYAISLSRRARRTIRQNLSFSIGVIVILVTAAATIGIPLPLGVVGHEGSTVIVVLNGLRLLRTPAIGNLIGSGTKHG